MKQKDLNKSGEPRANPGGIPAREGWSLVLLTTVMAAGLLLFYVFDPATSGGFWVCPFHRLTGWYCPGCGGQRALHELLHGHLAAAFRLNPFAVLAFFPLAGYAYAAYALRVMGLARLPGVALRNGQLLALLAAMVLFGILRNIWGPLP